MKGKERGMAEQTITAALFGGPWNGRTLELSLRRVTPDAVLRIRLPRYTVEEQYERRELDARGLLSDDWPPAKGYHYDEYRHRTLVIGDWPDYEVRGVWAFFHADWHRDLHSYTEAMQANNQALLDALKRPEPLDPRLLEYPPVPEPRCCNGTCDRWRGAADVTHTLTQR